MQILSHATEWIEHELHKITARILAVIWTPGQAFLQRPGSVHDLMGNMLAPPGQLGSCWPLTASLCTVTRMIPRDYNGSLTEILVDLDGYGGRKWGPVRDT